MFTSFANATTDGSPASQGCCNPARDEDEHDIQLPDGRAGIYIEVLVVGGIHYKSGSWSIVGINKWHIQIESFGVGSVWISGSQ